MDVEPDVTRLARTIGEPSRIRMLALLMDGRALTAKELAYGAGVEPATASTHLQRLQSDALVEMRAQGRHKYFRLASPAVAQCVEALMAVAPQVSSACEASPREPIHLARLCYDHLAGRLGTEILRVLVDREVIVMHEAQLSVTASGERWFADFGVDLAPLRRNRRQFARRCLDWSERHEHLGGAVGAALATRLLESGWVRRRSDSRVLIVTPRGVDALHQHFGLRWTGEPRSAALAAA